MKDNSGIIGVMLYSPEGIPIKTTVDNTTAAQYQSLVSTLTAAAQGVVRDLDPTNEMTFFRIRSNSHEILVAPDPQFLMVVLQKCDLSQESTQ